MRRPLVRTVALLAAVTALGACSDGDQPEDKDAAPCAAVEQFGTALDELDATFGGDASADDVREARERADEAQERLADAADEIAQEQREAFDDAWERLDDTLDDAEDGGAAAAAGTLREQAAEVATARDDLADALSC
ncbi:hypothetical protein GC089_00335 [Cellulomonas sp. JZ18]|uniref:hypothetical protein n=1 Tax=Cellulomonas sp. JZ18 TaxID=2654191 RepID=UPI0012D42320|nr:hypothetical protein [Cellulomonas sp. JZ18]QGQ17992.1 hypothetical protein GC089_00335 [Cellulomonas sp. JZ18]